MDVYGPAVRSKSKRVDLSGPYAHKLHVDYMKFDMR